MAAEEPNGWCRQLEAHPHSRHPQGLAGGVSGGISGGGLLGPPPPVGMSVLGNPPSAFIAQSSPPTPGQVLVASNTAHNLSTEMR